MLVGEGTIRKSWLRWESLFRFWLQEVLDVHVDGDGLLRVLRGFIFGRFLMIGGKCLIGMADPGGIIMREARSMLLGHVLYSFILGFTIPILLPDNYMY